MESLHRGAEVIIPTKEGLNLEWAVQKAHMGVTVSCPDTFRHIVYVNMQPNSWLIIRPLVQLEQKVFVYTPQSE